MLFSCVHPLLFNYQVFAGVLVVIPIVQGSVLGVRSGQSVTIYNSQILAIVLQLIAMVGHTCIHIF